MYRYEKEKPKIFSEENQSLFLGIRDQVLRHLESSGAVSMAKASALPKGVGAADLWTMMACVDRLVEIGEISEIPTSGRGQDRIFVRTRQKEMV